MPELIVFWGTIITSLYCFIVLLGLLVTDSPADLPKNLYMPLIVIAPLCIACSVYWTFAVHQERVNLIDHLEYQGTIYPKYVFEYDKFLFYHPSVEGPLVISDFPGYETDSAAIADGLMVYKKVYPRIWGFIEHVPKNESPYLFTFKVTPEIQRASQNKVELKE